MVGEYYVQFSYFNGFIKDCSISSALAMETLQSCSKQYSFLFTSESRSYRGISLYDTLDINKVNIQHIPWFHS